MQSIRSLFLAAVFALLCSFGPALAADWRVERVTLPAQYTTDGKTWKPVTRGMAVPNAAWINTGKAGRVLLRRKNDSLQINAYSLVAAVEKGSDSRPKTTLHQKFGEITVDVQKRGYDQMNVTTPFMAALVKGTKFTVYARQKRSSLKVFRGLVEVTDPRTGSRALVGAGGKAQINAASKSSIGLSGSNTSLVTASNNAATGQSNGLGIGIGGGNAGGNGVGLGVGIGGGNAGGNGVGLGVGVGGGNAGGNSGVGVSVGTGAGGIGVGVGGNN